MSEIKTISLDGSDDLFWDDIDKYARKKGFTTTSGFMQYLLEKEILGIKTKFKDKITYILLLLMLSMISLMILLVLR